MSSKKSTGEIRLSDVEKERLRDFAKAKHADSKKSWVVNAPWRKDNAGSRKRKSTSSGDSADHSG